MQSLEQSCRKASDVFTGMVNIVSTKKSKKFCYEMALDMYAAATWIENMRKVEFYFAQMYPDEYKDVLRQMQEDTEKEFSMKDDIISVDDSSIYPNALRSGRFPLKKGKWLPLADGWACCSECEHLERAAGLRWRYCPNCGARMEESDG